MASTRFYTGHGGWHERPVPNPLGAVPVAVHHSLSPGFAYKHAGRLADAARHWGEGEGWDGGFELFALRVGERRLVCEYGDGSTQESVTDVCVTLSRELWRQDCPARQWIELRAAGPADEAVAREFGR